MTIRKHIKTLIHLTVGAAIVSMIGFYTIDDMAMFGGTYSRNMVSSAANLPIKWDTESGMNVKWSAALGSQSYAGPVIFGDKIFVGSNNEGLYNPKVTGDRGNVMAFNLETGEFLWQIAHPKLPAGRVNDWPLQGVCSTPFIEGDRMYYLSNRCEVVCLDTEGFRDGENDGPVKDEKATSETDADVVWSFDMIAELDVFPHNLATSSPLVADGLVFLVTGNGVDEGHVLNPSPLAPSFLAVNKMNGKVVWEDNSPGENILHGQWSNPAYGVMGGKAQVIMPGGDGWLYSFEPKTGKLIWKFNCNPEGSVWELGGLGTKNNLISTPVIWENMVIIGVGQDPEHGEGIGHLWAIDATMTGDVTGKAVVWHRGGEDYNRTISTVAIDNGLLYASDLSGFLYCLDVKTGKHHWTYDSFAAIWGSPFVADGKVYLGDEDGDIAILATGTEKKVLAEINMGSAVYTTPVAQDKHLYVATRNRLFAISEAEK